ncbi:hypothetical protein [Desertibaculum subflavum]|uniref:hypothetical protein n=1 Tax=Desertibaculum subflavum TaxID=2268458 RepID=UPI0013C3F079
MRPDPASGRQGDGPWPWLRRSNVDRLVDLGTPDRSFKPLVNNRGNLIPAATFPRRHSLTAGASSMDGIIYLIGLIVVIMAILSFFGLR